jgi:adenylate cyclase
MMSKAREVGANILPTLLETFGMPHFREQLSPRRVRRAVLVVDMVDSVRLMERDELDVIGRWCRLLNEVTHAVMPKHGGRLVKSLGDGFLAEFPTARAAVRAAIDVQSRVVPTSNRDCEADVAIRLRAGVHVCELVVEPLDLFGCGVNLASRITTLAGPGEIVVSESSRHSLIDDFDADFEDLGPRWLKSYSSPVRVYKLLAMDSSSPLRFDETTHAVHGAR